jgi:FkbM family methyltransferase
MILQKKIDFLIGRFLWLRAHPEFRKNSLSILFRFLIWEVFKAINYQPIISIHRHSKMQLEPGAKRGIHGLIYIFRDNYESAVKYAVDTYCTKGCICYDIGANIGLWSLRISELVGSSGHVYAFEPMSKNLELLKRNISMSNQQETIEIVPYALGDKECVTKIYIPNDPGSTSLAPENSEDRFEEIQMKCLDAIWEAQGCPHIDFVKIDVEGSEPLILSAASRFFETVRPIVICEVNPQKLKALNKQPDNIFDTFDIWNYDVFVFNSSLNDIMPAEKKFDGDFIFIPRGVN